MTAGAPGRLAPQFAFAGMEPGCSVNNRKYTSTEIAVARVVCAVGGVLLVAGGWALATRVGSEAATIAGAVLAFLGACLTILGLFAPRNWCVRAADWIVTLVT